MGLRLFSKLFCALHPPLNGCRGSKTFQRRAKVCEEKGDLSTPDRLQAEIKKWNVGVDPSPTDVNKSISIDVSRLWIEPLNFLAYVTR